MKYFVACISLFLLPASILFAQESVGFADSEDIEPLLDYRLPDWGYSNILLSLDLNGNANYSKSRTSDPTTNRRDRRYSFYLNPSYDLYRESDERIFALQSDFSLRYYDRYNKNEGGDIFGRDQSDFDMETNLIADYKKYISSRFFLLLNENVSFSYENQFSQERENGNTIDQTDEYNRDFDSATKLGVGFGRVRNITPVIRAIRLNERYKAISGESSFDRSDIQPVADQFTRYQGYQNRYDRPEKYFWQDMNQAVNSSLSQLSMFDVFYLRDVLDEHLGQRYQGWEVQAGGIFYYSNNLHRLENPYAEPSLERSREISKNLGLFAATRWYNNLSLAHQIGLELEAERNYPLGDNRLLTWNTGITAEVEWLWNIADRFMLETALMNRYNVSRYDLEFSPPENQWNFLSRVRNNLIYFIENRLAFNAGLSFTIAYRGESDIDIAYYQKNASLRFNAGIRYYFNRNLY